jgi:hypothetical protein
MWIYCAIVQFGFVDVLTIHGRSSLAQFIPHADLLDTMEKTTISYGFLGSTSAFLAFAGFSFWSVLLLTFLGIVYLLLARQAGVVLRPFTLFGLVVSVIFTVIAFIFFIWPPAVGAIQAAILFAASWIRKER